MSPAELPKGSASGAFFRKIGKPEFAKATPAARRLSWLLLGVGDRLNRLLRPAGRALARATRARAAHRRGRAQSVRGLLTAGRCTCPAGYSELSGAIAPGADKPRLRPFSRLIRGGSATLPLCYPRLCLARSYRAHAGASCGKPSNCPCPVDPTPGQVQPAYARRPLHCSLRSL